MSQEIEVKTRGKFPSYQLGLCSFVLALLIWCLSRNYLLSAVGTAIGIVGFLAAEVISYQTRQEGAMHYLGVFIIFWWLIFFPLGIAAFGDVTGLVRLYLNLAEQLPILRSSLVTTILYDISILWFIPSGLLHLWLERKIRD